MILFDSFIAGTPKAQPRPRAFSRGGRASVFNPPTAKAWKSAVKAAIHDLSGQLITGPLSVNITLFIQRPKSHYGSKNKVPYLKPQAPAEHTQKPDVDNYAKAILDAVTDVKAWQDDSQVMQLTISKHWTHDHPGAQLTIEQV